MKEFHTQIVKYKHVEIYFNYEPLNNLATTNVMQESVDLTSFVSEALTNVCRFIFLFFVKSQCRATGSTTLTPVG